MNKIKIIRRYIELFIMSIIFLALVVCLLLKFTIFNRSYVENTFSDKHYKEVEKSLKKEMKHSMISSGIRDGVIDTMFDSNDIKDSINRTLDIVYDDYRYSYRHEKIEEKLRDNINKDFESQNFKSDDEAGLNNFVSSMMKIYEGEFKMLGKVSKLGKYMQFVMPFIDFFCCFFGIVFTVWLIIRRKYLTQILSIPLFTSSMLLLFAVFYISKRSGIDHFTVFSITFSKAIRNIVLSTFHIIKVVALVLFILGIIILLLHRVSNVEEVSTNTNNKSNDKLNKKNNTNNNSFNVIENYVSITREITNKKKRYYKNKKRKRK